MYMTHELNSKSFTAKGCFSIADEYKTVLFYLWKIRAEGYSTL